MTLSWALPAAGQSDWLELFDGRTLAGWTTTGQAGVWRVEDGDIVCSGQGGSWLRTTRWFRDFELELEFRIPPGGNSGVGLRGSSVGDPAFTGFEIQILDSAGQAPSVNNCGAVYDAIAPRVMAVRPPGQWNRYEIRLVGDRLTVRLNGEVIHDNEPLDDRGYFRTPDRPMPLRDRLPTGYIALQDHGNPVRFRHIRLRDLSPDPDPGDYVAIFNGQDLTGWEAHGTAAWSVENGTLVGRDGPGHLYSGREYGDFALRAMVRVNDGGNSGLYFRARRGAGFWPQGYEVQIDNHDPVNFTGCLYARARAAALVTRDGAWFDLRVQAEGDRIQTWVNGQLMVDAVRDEFPAGHIALQSHHPGNEVMWRDIQIRELSPVRGGHAAEGGSPP